MGIYVQGNFHNNRPSGFWARLFFFIRSAAFLAVRILFGTRKRRMASVTAISIAIAWQLSPWGLFKDKGMEEPVDRVYNVPDSTGHNYEGQSDEEYVYVPGPISMDKMKYQGCVADGLLSGYGSDTRNSIEMINRSDCLYLHRALETWASPPDFEKARGIMREIDRPGMIYGMFIAEALKTNSHYFNPEKNQNFDFREMCAPSSSNRWGEHTCIPHFKYEEYREYVEYITERAMDLGIQSFLFGQIYYQDDTDDAYVKKVIKHMREYAAKKGIQIAIGAQTGSITDEKYLKLFDYIEGGIGIGDDGTIESGPCWSRLSGCWALLWHDNYRKKANNVIVHLDWSGLKFDDMSSFARMDRERRKELLGQLHEYFSNRKVGFLLPLMATVNADNGGCYGYKKNFYSASNEWSCKDEDAINAIIEASSRRN